MQGTETKEFMKNMLQVPKKESKHPLKHLRMDFNGLLIVFFQFSRGFRSEGWIDVPSIILKIPTYTIRDQGRNGEQTKTMKQRGNKRESIRLFPYTSSLNSHPFQDEKIKVHDNVEIIPLILFRSQRKRNARVKYCILV